MTWVLPGVPFGPFGRLEPDLLGVAAAASSRSSWWRRTSVIS